MFVGTAGSATANCKASRPRSPPRSRQKPGGLGASCPQFSRGRMPIGRTGIAEQPHGQGRGVEHRHPLYTEVRQQLVERGVVQAVVTIGLDLIHFHLVQHLPVELQRQARNAHEARLARRLCFAQRRDRFVDDLRNAAELHVVHLDEINVLDAQPRQALVHAARHAVGGEVKVLFLVAVATHFCREEVLFAGDLAQGPAEHRFCRRQTVERRGVDQIDAAVDRRVHGAHPFRLVDVSERPAQRGPPEGQDRNIEAG